MDIGKETTINWDRSELDLFESPVVYIFWENDTPLYVGMSAIGIVRPLARNHHAVEARKRATRVEFRFVETKDHALILEQQLIAQHLPEFNSQGIGATNYKAKITSTIGQRRIWLENAQAAMKQRWASQAKEADDLNSSEKCKTKLPVFQNSVKDYCDGLQLFNNVRKLIKKLDLE